MTSTKLERSRMMGNYQVRFRSRVGRGDFLHLDNYGIGKFCEKVSEEKQNDPDMSMCTAIKNVLTPECLKSQSQVHP